MSSYLQYFSTDSLSYLHLKHQDFRQYHLVHETFFIQNVTSVQKESVYFVMITSVAYIFISTLNQNVDKYIVQTHQAK
ncbi:hypothetical protein A1OS_07560 [Enterovibrio norvegicus]|nr:hypothetical protein A1OS_07560 [Enterovibrio norvegicus]OEF55904.1 hypothetical protein A1OU_14075 [Enterovibrio norvegicus]PMH72131.1 hypothetical protein BCU62_03680 [Enterovibrio norvegicus]